ncbi:MAG: putative sulfate exporter family transporter [Thermodesulfovibrio sp.]|nr:putative sulfate exporter family transporter [Thermodesulfovibrio sp.]
MANQRKIDWSSLWKKEDWWGVWIGFFIIALILAGLQVKSPKLRWTTDAEFKSYAAMAAPQIEKLATEAEQKEETAVKDAALALKAAIDTADRKAISDAAKKLQDAAKAAKDEGIKKKAEKLGKDIKGQADNLTAKVFSWENIWISLQICIGYWIIATIAAALMGVRLGGFIVGFPIVFALGWIARVIAGNYTIHSWGIEYVLWCLIIGLLISNTVGVPQWFRSIIQTEFFIKSGLVILGSSILFEEILKAGSLGLIQAFLVVISVWYLTFWIAKKLRVDDEFAAVLASGVSICGVSAAIATAGAVKADPKKLSYTTSIILLCALPMLVGQPMIAKAVGMPDVVAGAWMGGTLDTSPSVVAAAALVSETAMKVGVIVKMSQNVLIGFAAFVLAVIWTFKKQTPTPGAEKPGIMEVWYRFPKFVLGFLIASFTFSFIIDPKTVEATKGILVELRTWWFAMAFVCIGLETRFVELIKMEGGRPALAFVIGQAFNIVWTLILAYLLFGGILFPAPKF